MGKRTRESLLMWTGGDVNVLKSDHDDGYTTLRIY